MFQWLTNAQKLEHGRIPVLEAMAGITAMSIPNERGGKDLKDQLDYLYSVDDPGQLYAIQVVFGLVFGLVCFFSQVPSFQPRISEGASGSSLAVSSPRDGVVIQARP